MGFLVPLAGAAIGALGTAAAGAGSVLGGIGSAVGSGLGALGAAAGTGGSVIGGLNAAGGLASSAIGLVGALNPPKPPAPMMAAPIPQQPNPPKNSNTSFAALATPSGQTSFGAPNSGRSKTLLGQ